MTGLFKNSEFIPVKKPGLPSKHQASLTLSGFPHNKDTFKNDFPPILKIQNRTKPLKMGPKVVAGIRFCEHNLPGFLSQAPNSYQHPRTKQFIHELRLDFPFSKAPYI